MTENKNDELIIHVVCHTHDDPGWLWPLDDYYLGTADCKVSVKRILDNMIISLENNPERKFSYVEMCFFKQWYESQTEKIKSKIKSFVEKGRLEFINGGWVMHDEACVHYTHILDNMRLGLKFLKDEFNYTPKIGWFIDPFGHSSTNAEIFRQMKFKYLVLTRIDQQEKNFRIKNHNMEFIYKPYKKINNDDNGILTHISYHHYCPRNILRRYPCDKEIKLNDSELKEICEKFYQEMLEEKIAYKHNNILLYYGDDFVFNEIDINYNNIEQIMNYVNENYKGKMKMIYSTPSQYFEEVEKYRNILEDYNDYDFFPYAENPHSYWTGYFSSRINLKGLIKTLANYLNLVQNLYTIFKIHRNNNNFNFNIIQKSINYSREKLGVLQHHDAITGTAKEKTNKDYENMAITSIEKLKYIINILITELTDYKIAELNLVNLEENNFDYLINLLNNQGFILNTFTNNNFLNIRLKSNENNLNNSENFSIKNINYNNFKFYDIKTGLKYNSLQFINNFKNLIEYFNLTNKESLIVNKKQFFSEILDKEIEIIPNVLKFNPKLSHFTLIKQNDTFIIKHQYYTSYDGKNSLVRPLNSNPDGSYIFAPCENNPQDFYINYENSFLEVSENHNISNIVIRYLRSYLIITIVKLNKDDQFEIYIESIYDPINRYEEIGYNHIVTIKCDYINNISNQYKTPMFYTDSEGLNMLQRIKDFRNYPYEVSEKVTSNYYPLSSYVSIRDNNDETININVFVDRPESCGIINKGEIQLLSQRYSIKDDWKGCGEGLYENSSMNRFYTVKHLITFNSKENKDNYFNNIPAIFTNVKEIKENNNIIDNIKLLDELIIDKNDLKYLRINSEILDENKIFIQIVNNSNKYFESKEEVVFKFNIEILKNIEKIIEYEINGLNVIKDNINISDEIKIKNCEFKLFLFQFKK